MKQKQNISMPVHSRRMTAKLVAMGAGSVAASAWIKPVVETVALPVHAAMTESQDTITTAAAASGSAAAAS